MAKIQQIRRRIKSVKNIKQITKAMEMVAASKLRRAQEATLNSRVYAIAMREAIAQLRRSFKAGDHELFKQRPVKSQLIILISSDRGLAGAYNSNLFKVLLAELREAENRQPAVATKLIVIGSKGAQFAARLTGRVELVGSYTDWPAAPLLADIQPIVKTALKLYRKGEVDQCSVIYTDFVSMVKQAVKRQDILPIDPDKLLPPGAEISVNIRESIFEPSPAAVLDFIIPRFIDTQIYQATLEANASEQVMRMMAMKSASDNAEELTDDLTLTYNGARQAVITQELSEITAGAEALN